MRGFRNLRIFKRKLYKLAKFFRLLLQKTTSIRFPSLKLWSWNCQSAKDPGPHFKWHTNYLFMPIQIRAKRKKEVQNESRSRILITICGPFWIRRTLLHETRRKIVDKCIKEWHSSARTRLKNPWPCHIALHVPPFIFDFMNTYYVIHNV